MPGGETWRVIHDHLGSVRLVVRVSDGAILRSTTYDAYGRLRDATFASGHDLATLPFGYAGGFTDANTGLVRFGARFYDPETGRWLSKDPSQFGGGGNFYAYAGGDPVNFVDPTGNVPEAARELGYGFAGVGREDAETRYAITNNWAMELAREVFWAYAFGFAFDGVVAARAARALPAAESLVCEAAEGAARGTPKLLNPVRNFAEGQLDKHFAKHAAEWGAGNITKQGYLKRAQDLLSRQPGGDILGHTRRGGDILRYNARTNEFAVGAADGTIRTLFRPADGMGCWIRQVAP